MKAYFFLLKMFWSKFLNFFFFEIKHEHHEKLEKKHMFNQIATCWTLVCGLNLFEFKIKSILFLIPNQMSYLINKIILNSICLAFPSLNW